MNIVKVEVLSMGMRHPSRELRLKRSLSQGRTTVALRGSLPQQRLDDIAVSVHGQIFGDSYLVGDHMAGQPLFAMSNDLLRGYLRAGAQGDV
jgi:hypothetical protein